MKLIYLKEGRIYSDKDLKKCISSQHDSKEELCWIDSTFFERLRDSINSEFKKTVVKGTEGRFVFHYIGLYDYVDTKTRKNITFFFVPKFIDFQVETDCNDEDVSKQISSINNDSWNKRIKEFDSARNSVLLAIDRYNKEQTQMVEQVDASEIKRESILELAVRMLRDYLENGLYIVHKNELEHNGQGEINWEVTLESFVPVFVNKRPYYIDTMTEQAYSDEEHYIMRLHKCLVTIWGAKLEKLGLASVLRVNVPLLSKEELNHFGGAEYQITQINKELNVQFVTKYRETLKLLKELIERSSENNVATYESLSFGMNGVEHLWERACAEVLGSELDKKIKECDCFKDVDILEDLTFSSYMPKVYWKQISETNPQSKEFAYNEGSQHSKKAGWKLDFIRTFSSNETKRLVILDSKYYCVRWRGCSISGQPGTPDIAKQMFYQMCFADLIENTNVKIVNAFLFPEDDNCLENNEIQISETMQLGWQTGDRFKLPIKFRDINLFAVRIPGIVLLKRYANLEHADDWFNEIALYK